MAAKDFRRAKGAGSLFQRCEARCGCPPLVDGPAHPRTGKPTKVRPKHDCHGMWVAVVELPAIGDERRRRTIVRAKKDDALRALRAAQTTLARRGDLGAPAPTLAAWIEEWWEGYAPNNIKVTQWSNYQAAFRNYIIPFLGKKKLDKIDVGTVERWHRWMVAPKPEGAGIAPRTALGAHQILSTVLTYAMRREKIERNVATIAGPPRVLKREKGQLDNAEALAVLKMLDPDDGTVPMMLAMFAVAFFLGPRPSELIGLTRDAIDLDAGQVTISWQLQRIKPEHGCGDKTDAAWPCGKKPAAYCPKRTIVIPDHTEARHVEGTLYLVRPKTPTSWRALPIPPLLATILGAYLEGAEPGMEGLIFHRPRGGKGKGAATGRPISLEDWNKRWHETLTAAKITRPDDEDMPTPHSARRTCNTILTELGYPVDVRTKILGHAGAEVNKVYTHTSDTRVLAALDGIGTALDWRQ
jgi:integrase